jgi:hypothetical protein
MGLPSNYVDTGLILALVAGFCDAASSLRRALACGPHCSPESYWWGTSEGKI